MLWTALIDMLCAGILSLTQVLNGSLGLAVCMLSLALRLLLLPLTLRLARRALVHQRRLLAFQPEVDRLRTRYANDPARQLRETMAFYERRGINPTDPAGVIGGLVQLPVLGAFFAALRRGLGAGVRFLWVKDLAKPNVIIALAATLVAVVSVGVAPPVDPSRRLALVPLIATAVVTLWILGSNSALFAVASGASTIVNVLQSWLLRRADRRDRLAA
jgi:YidC/Oxa1 family membrane protein insertase